MALSDLDDQSVFAVLRLREEARSRRDFAQSDALRETLRSHGVEVYDRERVFTTRDGRRVPFPTNPPPTTASAQVGLNPQLDDATIHQVLQQREIARSRRDFKTADALREQLRQFDIKIFDNDKIWVTSTGRRGSFAGAAPAPPPPVTMGGVGGQAQGQPGLPLGALSDMDIAQAVLQREQARQQKNYSLSDAIRDQLRCLGIDVFDKEKMWRSWDGRVGIIGGFAPWPRLKDHEIRGILMKRDEAKSVRDWPLADRIRDELRSRGIEVFDKERMWRSNDGRTGGFVAEPSPMTNGVGTSSGPSEGDTPDGSSEPNSAATVEAAADAAAAEAVADLVGDAGEMDELSDPANGAPDAVLPDAEILSILSEREACRKAKDWITADNYRDRLRAAGVDVFDKDRTWRSKDGRSGMIPMEEGAIVCSLTNREIQALVASRETARQAKDWVTADNLRNQLRAQGVDVFDKEKFWRTSDGRRGDFELAGPSLLAAVHQANPAIPPGIGIGMFAPNMSHLGY